MKIFGKKEPFILLAGDVLFLIISLWLSLFVRSLSVPSFELFYDHLVPFAVLFVVWVTVFYIAGLYGKHTVILRSKLPNTLLNAQLTNIAIAVLFFYVVPFFGITPKTVLFIYLAISFIAILVWRIQGYFYVGSRTRENAVLIGVSKDMSELVEEINQNDAYNIKLVDDISKASIVIADFSNEKIKSMLPDLYGRIFSGTTFVDVYKFYEDIFDRVPLPLLSYNWFLENISTRPRTAYDTLKRMMDIVLAFMLGIASLVLYPFVYMAIKLDDGGPVFIAQERVGQNNEIVRIHKFRSMNRNDDGVYSGKGERANKVTRVGTFLRKSRIDELPQLWNVFKGDISLIGPRPELPSLVKLYEKEIPYYNVRHIIKPGLSGWAQISQENHPHHKEAVNETKEKLTYDLYYIKERSLFLDLKIALRTIKTLIMRVGV